MPNSKEHPTSLNEATEPYVSDSSAADEAWQDSETRKALGEADAGDFAPADEVMKTIRKFAPDA